MLPKNPAIDADLLPLSKMRRWEARLHYRFAPRSRQGETFPESGYHPCLGHRRRLDALNLLIPHYATWVPPQRLGLKGPCPLQGHGEEGFDLIQQRRLPHRNRDTANLQ
jgi:hypothetical protein